jgi:hypothetical protein
MHEWMWTRWVLAAMAAVLLCPPGAAAVSPLPETLTPAAHAAIQRGLAHLVRVQRSDGRWPADTLEGPDMRSAARYPCVMTSLAGLALMADGNTPGEGRYAENVRRAVEFVAGSANDVGLIAGETHSSRSMYGHGFSMLFLAQAYGMESDPGDRARLRKVLEAAIQLTVRAQADSGSWSYTPDYKFEPGEGSVTITQIQGLRACRNAGIKVPKATIDRACAFIERCAQPGGGIAYQLGRNETRPPITAAAVACMYNAGEYENPVAHGAMDFTIRHLRRAGPWDAYKGHATYGLLYAAQSIWFAGDEVWEELFPRLRDGLVQRQHASGAILVGRQGDVYSTAVALIILQLPNQYLPILQR